MPSGTDRSAAPLDHMDAATRAVVGALRSGHRYGLDIVRTCRMKPSAVYPILARLEEFGWVTAEWQEAGPSTLPRGPRRRLYRMTDGAAPLAEVALRPGTDRGRSPHRPTRLTRRSNP